nr:hypothetical protein [Tanacetum cinerariifolium]
MQDKVDYVHVEERKKSGVYPLRRRSESCILPNWMSLEHVKIISEGVWAVDKCFPSIPTKQRSLPKGLSGVSRMGLPNVIDVNQQKAKERVINTVPNKWTRTSKVDVHSYTLAGSSVNIEKDKEALRGPLVMVFRVRTEHHQL